MHPRNRNPNDSFKVHPYPPSGDDPAALVVPDTPPPRTAPDRRGDVVPKKVPWWKKIHEQEVKPQVYPWQKEDTFGNFKAPENYYDTNLPVVVTLLKTSTLTLKSPDADCALNPKYNTHPDPHPHPNTIIRVTT